jgi:LPXTG-motif cell wall-anchored protein
VINEKTGDLNGGMVFTGISLLVCATLALLLPKKRMAA